MTFNHTQVAPILDDVKRINTVSAAGEARWLARVWRSTLLLCGLTLLLLLAALLVGRLFPGRQLAYVVYTAREGRTNADIYILDIDHDLQYNLTNTPEYDLQPAWSPDGARMAFISTRSTGGQLYVVDASGANLRRLTQDDNFNHSNPFWSPDGRSIYFTRGQTLWIIDADGGNLQQLTTNGTETITMLVDLNPTLPSSRITSPDGSRTLFISFRNGEWGIFAQETVQPPAAPPPPQPIATLGRVYNEPPVWAPDNRYIAFIHSGGGQRSLYVMRSDGTDRRQLTFSRDYVSQVQWRP